MPQLGETVNEGTIAVWYVKVGDVVEKDQPLFDVETDKAAVEVTAPEKGVVSAIEVELGNEVDVGTLLMVLDVEGEESTVQPAQSSSETEAKETDVRPANPVSTALAPTAGHEKVNAAARLSPAVRRLVAEHALEVSLIEGTGKGGRVTRQNVLAYIESGGAASSPSAQASFATGRTSAIPTPEPMDARSVIPFDRIRKMTAEHMLMSKQTSPHVLQAVEVEYTSVDLVRKSVGAKWKADNGFSLTYLPFIARAIALAIKDFPKMNASVEGESLRVHSLVNLGIAVDMNFEGLVVPVVKDCRSKTVAQIAQEIRALSLKARNRKLTPDDFAGGTYTISNSGPFGTHITAPVINQPQIAIMSTDGIKKRPVVVESELGDTIAIRPVGILAQSFDHRAIDGAYSAAFLNRVREILVNHNWMAEV
jgi:2-oxoglutarate dehydrogenase E2 component (dihydrolipoamide succinyltransferase)